jgi:hypothetical protein
MEFVNLLVIALLCRYKSNQLFLFNFYQKNSAFFTYQVADWLIIRH